jgi:type II secretion system protein N
VSPERFRALRRAAGIVAFGVVVFFVSFMLSFPYERVKDQVVAQAAAAGLDMEVGSTGPVLGIGVLMKEVTLRTRPEPGKKASVIPIERARLTASPLASLRGEAAYQMQAVGLGGEIEASMRGLPPGVPRPAPPAVYVGQTRLVTREIAMNELSGSRSVIPLPLAGRLDMELDLKTPNQRNGEANGNLEWKWTGAALGDGKEKLRVAGNPFLSEGIVVPRIRLGDFKGKVQFTKGVGKLQGVTAKSPDGEVRIEGEIRLSDPVGYSYVDLYVVFRLTEAVLKANEKLGLMMQFAEGGKRSDGFYGFRLTGSFNRLGPPQWMQTSPFPAGGTGTRAAIPRPPSPGTLIARKGIDVERARQQLDPALVGVPVAGGGDAPTTPPPASPSPPPPATPDGE